MGFTYYIDFVNGGDANNNGVTKNSPWKRHPYMTGFNGTYVHRDGDQFMFKGGVTWPASCFPMSISKGGSTEISTDTVNDYYGSDPTWFTGTAWSRPIFDFAYSGGIGTSAVIITVKYVTIDNIEFKRFLCTSTGGGQIVNQNGWGATPLVLVKNCLFHDWQMPSATTDLGTGVVKCESGATEVSHCEFHQQGTTQKNGRCCWNSAWVNFCNIHDTTQGIIGTAGGGWHDNTIHDFPDPTDPNTHNNAMQVEAWPSTNYIYNNLLYNLSNFTTPLNTASTTWVYNNVLWNTGFQTPISIDTRHVGPDQTFAHVFNNVVEGYIQVGPDRAAVLEIQNNLVIQNTGTAIVLQGGNASVTNTIDHNVTLTFAQLDAQGLSRTTNYQPTSASTLINNLGVDKSSVFTVDRLNTIRSVPWDIGAYDFGGQAPSTQPVISVNPSLLDFGVVAVNATPADQSVVVSNTGTGTLTGSITVPQFFSVVGDSTYSLTSGQTKSLVIRYRPTQRGTHDNLAMFSGGAGTAVQLKGKAYPVSPVLQFYPTDGLVVAPFIVDAVAQTVSQSNEVSDPTLGGQFRIGFTATATGSYTVSAMVNAPDSAHNSFYIGIDTFPTEPANVWDVILFTTGYQSRTASWRGTGTFDNPQFSPKTWSLTAGQTYQLIICGREANVGLGQITINAPGPTIPSAPATPTTPSPANNATNVLIGTTLSWAETDTVSGYNVYLGTTNPPPLVSSSTTGTTYNPTAQLEYNTLYYAKVNAYLNWTSAGQSGTVTSGDLTWSFTTEQFVPPPPPPLAITSITANPNHGNPPLSVAFSAVLTGTAPYTYDWDWADGSSHGTTAAPSHTFVSPGTFIVTLNVVDANGLTATGSKTVNSSQIIPPPALTASLAAVPTSAGVGTTVTFTTTSSGGVSGAKTYDYDFGDGNTSLNSTAVKTHVYSAAGTFTAVVTVTDIGSHTATASAQVVIAASPPVVAFTSPTDNSTYSAPATVPLGAVAAGNAGATITGVSFYRGGSTLISAATLVAGVWTYSWTGVTAGDYIVTARATDSNAVTTVSAPINIHVLAAGTVQVPRIIYITP